MSITILTGLPASGKSEQLIKTIAAATDQGRDARTICCSDSPTLQARAGITEYRQLGSRSGLSTALDHFVSANEAIELLGAASDGALLAFEEAQHFGDSLIEAWCDASQRGVEILIASPSASQIKALNQRGFDATRLALPCQSCEEREASTFFLHQAEDRTESVCESCHDRLKTEVEFQIVDRLRCQDPYPGEDRLYQPIELSACKNWDIIRADSDERYQIIKEACAGQGLPTANSTYLDIGCNTGFFCNQMSKAGFRATGVDVVANDIEVARLLSTYVRRDYATYIISDAYEYLHSTQDQIFDVTSAFSVFQWVMIQNTPEHGLNCMRWLFQKSRRICVLEMGESTEAHYIERVGLKYDRDWIYGFMQDEGNFDRIDIIDMIEHKLKRDFFIGFKA